MSLALALAKVNLAPAPAPTSVPAKPDFFYSVRQHPKIAGMAIVVSVKPNGNKTEKAMWRPEANAKVFALKQGEQDYRASVKAWEAFHGKRKGAEDFRAKVAKAFAEGRKPRLGRLA